MKLKKLKLFIVIIIGIMLPIYSFAENTINIEDNAKKL